jgi:hypothetical protein
MNGSSKQSAFERLIEASAFAAALFTVACGGTSDPDADTAGDFETLTVVTYPGYVQESPPGSSCRFEAYAETETVVAAAHVLTWDYCAPDDGSTLYEPQQGERSLSDDEFVSVVAAVSNVTPSNAMTCGADASVVTLDVATATGTQRYANDFYSACPWEVHEGRTFAKGVVDTGSLLSDLARK